MTIGITGATGQLGRHVVQTLKGTIGAENVVALVRSAAKAADLGVSAREANYDDPGALDQALSGIDVLVLISASDVGKRLPQHQNVISAARKAGVKRIVYTSILRADTSSLQGLADEHAGTETALKASGVPFTILRNGCYTENYTNSISGALAGGAFIGSASGGKIASAARQDYAEAAAVVASSEGHAGKTYELVGDTAYTLSELAAEVSKQTGKTIPYQNLPETEYASMLAGFGIPPAFATLIASWDVSASQGALFDDGRQLSALIGRPTTPLSTVVARALTQKS